MHKTAQISLGREMKPFTNINATKSKGKGLPIRRHPLLSALLEADIQDVETMEAFFEKSGRSYKAGMSDRQRLCNFVFQLIALIEGKRLPALSNAALTPAEFWSRSGDERTLTTRLIYLHLQSSIAGRRADSDLFVFDSRDEGNSETHSTCPCNQVR
jgi:hypothetical protein